MKTSKCKPSSSVKDFPEGKINVAVAWNELPVYAARLMRAGIERLGRPVAVIATRPRVPIEGMEEALGQKIFWIDDSDAASWKALQLSVPELYFQPGWAYPPLNSLGAEVRSNGGKVVALVDNCWKGSWRQWLGALKFRLVYRKWFSAVWVPGQSGVRLCRFLGMPSSRIYEGLYGADPVCFSAGPPLYQRAKQFIFVGQFIPRKGISVLVKAFAAFHQDFPDWRLVTYGAGESQSLMENRPGIEVHPFAQPPQIAEALRRSRFLVLPSLVDHWPLIVSEAAVAGCGLIVSDKVGNREDLVSEMNGLVFPARSSSLLTERLKEAASIPDWRLDEIYGESRRLGSIYGPEQWGQTFCQIVSEVGDIPR